MKKTNPIAEVFGFPSDNMSETACQFRESKLCPFYNTFPNCTKNSAKKPLGVCSVNYNGKKIITCPSRFREDWMILRDAASFVWPKSKSWVALPEIRLQDARGQSAGNIDYVIVRYDETGKITDFASLEVQGVYISGNLGNPFDEYMKNPSADFTWDGDEFPRPDFLSSSRKRLIPQMLYKGGIFKAWGKKQCVAIQKSFFDTLPKLPTTTKSKADIAWFLYDLKFNEKDGRNHLVLVETVYTEFKPALNKVIYTEPGDIKIFEKELAKKFKSQKKSAPETHSVFELL